MLSNFHIHTDFCDGKSTPEEIVLYAIEKGFDAIGFSGHGYTPYDISYCIKDMNGYISSVNKLKAKYKNKIQIYLGIEEDSFSLINRNDFDYIIGSCHYFCVDEKYYPVDLSCDFFKKCLHDFFDDDIIKLSHAYYESFCYYIKKRKPDIVGHFDLITKYNDDGSLFDVNDPRYISAWQNAADAILKTPALVEINTGGMSRGYKKTPYPSKQIIEYFKSNGKKLIFSSDCHNKNFLLYGYDEVKKYL